MANQCLDSFTAASPWCYSLYGCSYWTVTPTAVIDPVAQGHSIEQGWVFVNLLHSEDDSTGKQQLPGIQAWHNAENIQLKQIPTQMDTHSKKRMLLEKK